MNAVLDQARTFFPRLQTVVYNDRSRPTSTPCALGALMLTYGKLRRSHGLPRIDGINFSPFPSFYVASIFVQQFLAAHGVSVSKTWCDTLCKRVIPKNDGSVEEQSWKRVPKPDVAWAILKESLEAKLSSVGEPEQGSEVVKQRRGKADLVAA